MTKIIGIIPARYASTRFPGKPLVDILSKSMIQRTYEQALKSEYLSSVVVATDDQRIFDHVLSFGGKVIMTSVVHESGTDRVYEAYRKLAVEADFVINIQGDEPFIPPKMIDDLASKLTKDVQLATLSHTIADGDEITSPNTVKVITDISHRALYFSRSPIPYLRNIPQEKWVSFGYKKHIGIYAYSTTVLQKITSLEVSSLEKAESLEQLRWLENGFDIHVWQTEEQSISIDTPEDLQHLIKIHTL